MTRNRLALLSALLVLVMLGAGIAAAQALPDGASLPVHWNQYGLADRFGTKWEGLLGPAALTGMVSFLFFMLPHLEPHVRGLERSRGLYLGIWLGLLVVMVVTELAILSSALNWGLPVPSLMHGAIGVLFILMGNQLGKSRRMFLVGIRTPWTLASEDVWIRTHRLAGKLLAGGGLLLLAATLAQAPSLYRGALLIGVIAVALGLPAAFSFWLWRKEQRAAAG